MDVRRLVERLLPFDELRTTILRFPFSVLCAFGLFIMVVGNIHNFINFDHEIEGRILATLGCLYFWFGFIKLAKESLSLKIVTYTILCLVGAAAITALLLLTEMWGLHLMFIMPALLLGLMVAPYLAGGDDLSFWFFNRKMWFGVFVSYAALILFAGGVSAALGAIDLLFNVKIDSKIYGDIWFFASFVLGPIYALSWVPKQFEFKAEDCVDPPGLKFIVNWISAPMAFVYLLILYAYFIKIVLTGDVPNGHLAYLITGFAGAGIVTYLMAWPLREEGSSQLRLFYKIFFPALLIPVGFHFYAIWERMSAYGVTEQRYFLLLSAVWFSMLAITNSFQKIPIKVIPTTLAILLVLASFGPWGGVSLSGHSQFSRLQKLLISNNILINGELLPVAKSQDVSFEDRKSISSILDYLCQTERDYLVVGWIGESSCDGGRNFKERLGFDYISNYERSDEPFKYEHVDISRPDQNMYNIAGYDRIIEDVSFYKNLNEPDGQLRTFKAGDHHVEMNLVDGVLKIVVDEKDMIDINIQDFFENQWGMAESNRDYILQAENDNIAVRFVFSSFGGEIRDSILRLSQTHFDFLYRIK